MWLCESEEGLTLTVRSVSGEGEEALRLSELGFTPGTDIFVLKIAPKKSAFLVVVRGCRLALTAAAARLIAVGGHA